MPPTSKVASPASTGGAGTFFEQHVVAYWLAQLLVRGIPPILHDCAVLEVHLQTERLGWHTDDFLIVGENGSGNRRKLAGQVKRTFTVSATDDECKKAVTDSWEDFKNPGQFSPAADRFALITLRGTNTLLEHFAGLLDCARAARDATEFERRLATRGFLSAKAVEYCGAIRTIIGESEGRSVSAAEVWPFLRVLHVLSLDLNTSTRQTEAAIKTLLAYTAGEHDPIGAAEASWNALLREVGEGMPEARTFRWGDLPEALRRRHSAVSGTEQRALRALADHSALILDSIRSTIGRDLHLSRGRLVQQVIDQLESTQVVLVSGAAGSGKSGIAKDAIGILAADHFVFSFRAEEFASPHLDETLQRNQIPSTAAMLGAIVAGQGRKVLLVESVERLLEASTRDAFTDLLTLVARDRNWRMILTCRDYSADLVRTCFLEASKVGHSVVTIPLLDDEELREVEATHAMLAHPLANPALRRLLRNPYVLDKALLMPWPEESPLPQSERDFRMLFWQEIVRAQHRAAGGMPRRRENAFVQVALRRARALTLYAPCGDLDAEAVDVLRRDSLVVCSRQSAVLLAPAHDVLEDWAILQWIDEQYVTHDGLVRELSAVIGVHPAVRRTYRKWVSELVARDPAAADSLFQAVVHDSGLPAQFRDDTFVSLLRSPASPTFLERHTPELFANGKQLLRRATHLLRVACVTTPTWLETTTARPSLFNVPEGPAWACLLRLVQNNLASFDDGDRALLLGLIEDWARGVSWQCPYPAGAGSAAAIAHWLLPEFDEYRSEDPRKRTLKVIAKIPNADRDRFAVLLEGSRDDEERDRVADDLREIIFEGMEGMSAARDMPELVVSTATHYLLCSEPDLQDGWAYASDLELEGLFGVKYGRSHGFFPASAYRGPFLPLLRNHPRQGLDFIIAVFNHSADWYAHPRVHSEYVEPPFELTLTFADGTSRTQLCNARLWNLYRGTSVGPCVLQCLLMATERWLLELGEARPRELDGVLLHILKESTSAALTGVVASVATAFPHESGETLLILLRSPLCILLDRQRLVAESQAPSGIYESMPRLNNRNEIYEDERKAADALPHRRRDLEMAIANLQLGPLAPRVHQILDQHRSEMPPPAEQEEEHCIWRLAMHRMDLRQYTVAEDAPEEPVAADEQNSPSGGPRYIRLDLKVPEPDVKQMVDQSTAQQHALNARLGLLMWGMKVFRGEDPTAYKTDQWRERLKEAQGAVVGSRDDRELGQGGPGYIAAVCVRDHWDEMTEDDQCWCVNIVCSEVEQTGDYWNAHTRVQRYNMAADRPCAWVLSVLLGNSLPEAQQSRTRRLLLIALTHPVTEVRWYAAWGVGKNLWAIDRDLAIRCVNAIATEAGLAQQAAEAERSRLLHEKEFAKLHGGGWIDAILGNVASVIRKRFFEQDAIPEDALQTYDPTRWFGAEASGRILAILGQAPTEPIAIAGFERIAHTLVGWWDADEDRHRDSHERQRERDHETESALLNLLENFLLRTSAAAAPTILQPILDAIDRHPRQVHWILRGLIGVEDREPNTPRFWLIWRLFADRVRRARWLRGIDAEHPTGDEMMSALFLGTWWKDGVRHWRSLEGNAAHVHVLFEALPASAIVLDDYVRFLYHIGEQSLPEAFIRIGMRLQQGDPRQMLRKGNTVFLLEVLLQRYVYGRPLELKRQTDLREAVLFLLDLLVESGSSAAFRMRDDFVTPVEVIGP